jgi:small GTP-binding protein
MLVEAEHVFKVVIVGPIAVGKTTLVRRYTDRVFVEGLKRTLGVDFALTRVVVKPTAEVNRVRHILLQLWDFAGGGFESVFPHYLTGANTVMLVFDGARRETFEVLPQWLKIIRHWVSNVPIILIATKNDLEPDVSPASIKHFMAREAIEEFYQTSSKTGQNVDEVFQRCVSYALEQI